MSRAGRPPATRLVLVRHGESHWNAEGRIQGQSGSGLSPRGREQSRLTAELVAGAYPGALLVVSDQQRCQESAAPIAAALGTPAHTERGLRERDFGSWTGLLREEVEAGDGHRWRRWTAGEDVVAEVGGESAEDLSARVVATLRRLAAAVAGRPVVAVTHGGPIWHGTRALLGLPAGALGGVANASVTDIDLASRGDVAGDGYHVAWLVSWNQVAHLPVELRQVARAADGRPAQARPARH